MFEIDAPRQVARFRGRVWWVRLGNREIPIAGTYFTGNNRHRGFDNIVKDIERLLKMEPRTREAYQRIRPGRGSYSFATVTQTEQERRPHIHGAQTGGVQVTPTPRVLFHDDWRANDSLRRT